MRSELHRSLSTRNFQREEVVIRQDICSLLNSKTSKKHSSYEKSFIPFGSHRYQLWHAYRSIATCNKIAPRHTRKELFRANILFERAIEERLSSRTAQRATRGSSATSSTAHSRIHPLHRLAGPLAQLPIQSADNAAGACRFDAGNQQSQLRPRAVGHNGRHLPPIHQRLHPALLLHGAELHDSRRRGPRS